MQLIIFPHAVPVGFIFVERTNKKIKNIRF